MIDTIKISSPAISDHLYHIFENQSRHVTIMEGSKVVQKFTSDRLRGSYDTSISVRVIRDFKTWVTHDVATYRNPKNLLMEVFHEYGVEVNEKFLTIEEKETRALDMTALDNFSKVFEEMPDLGYLAEKNEEELFFKHGVDLRLLTEAFYVKDFKTTDYRYFSNTTGLTSKEIYKRRHTLLRLLKKAYGSFKTLYVAKVPPYIEIELSLPKYAYGINGLWGFNTISEVLEKKLLPDILRHYKIPNELDFPPFQLWAVKRVDFSMNYHIGDNRVFHILEALKNIPMVGSNTAPSYHAGESIYWTGAGYILKFYHKGKEQKAHKDLNRLKKNWGYRDIRFRAYSKWVKDTLRVELGLKGEMMKNAFNCYPIYQRQDYLPNKYGYNKRLYNINHPQLKDYPSVFIFDKLQNKYGVMELKFNEFLSKLFVGKSHVNARMFNFAMTSDEVRERIRNSKYNMSLFSYWNEVQTFGLNYVKKTYPKYTTSKNKKKLLELGITLIGSHSIADEDKVFRFDPDYRGLNSMIHLGITDWPQLYDYLENNPK